MLKEEKKREKKEEKRCRENGISGSRGDLYQVFLSSFSCENQDQTARTTELIHGLLTPLLMDHTMLRENRETGD